VSRRDERYSLRLRRGDGSTFIVAAKHLKSKVGRLFESVRLEETAAVVRAEVLVERDEALELVCWTDWPMPWTVHAGRKVAIQFASSD
jgi:hypothetical protein